MDDFDSLRICPDCDCRLCFESASHPVTAGSWLLVLQCPNCWSARSRMVTDTALELLEFALDDDMRVIAAELEQLEYANAVAEAEELETEISRFAAALEADAILPMDF
jgi:hypothetical protein